MDIIARVYSSPYDARVADTAPELLEAALSLVCCPAFTGALFERDKESHRAWTIARLAIAHARDSKV